MTPDFNEAVTRFKKFVQEQGQPPRLMRARPKDVLVAENRRLYVRVGVEEQNEKLARNAFEEGRRRGLGVELATLCQLRDMTCCYAWAPADEEPSGDASYASRFKAVCLQWRIPLAGQGGEQRHLLALA